MPVSFRWQQVQVGGPPAPFIAVRLSTAVRNRVIAGVYDTGADVTTLNPEWKDRLRIADSQCAPTPVSGVAGPVGLAPLTMVTAELDGHQFRMPVLFQAGVSVDLFGRVGIFDQFTIKHDPVLQMTTFEWIGPQGPSWADNYERQWREDLAAGNVWPPRPVAPPVATPEPPPSTPGA